MRTFTIHCLSSSKSHDCSRLRGRANYGPAKIRRVPGDRDERLKRASLRLSRVSDCPSAKRNKRLRVCDGLPIPGVAIAKPANPGQPIAAGEGTTSTRPAPGAPRNGVLCAEITLF